MTRRREACVSTGGDWHGLQNLRAALRIVAIVAVAGSQPPMAATGTGSLHSPGKCRHGRRDLRRCGRNLYPHCQRPRLGARRRDRLRVLPVVGKGSLQNVTDILFLRGIDIGIVQSDVLTYARRSSCIPESINPFSTSPNSMTRRCTSWQDGTSRSSTIWPTGRSMSTSAEAVPP